MFKAVPQAVGCTVGALLPADTQMQVTSAMYGNLLNVLGVEADHTYLAIGTAPSVEYVKATVSATPNLLAIERSVDNTTAGTFASNTPARYVLAAEAIAEIAAEVGMGVDIEGDGSISVDHAGGNHYIISMDEIQISSSNGTVQVEGGAPFFDLSVNPNQC